ncbi:MAG: class I SAM-dependent methyltransferase [Anaerolineales bacterium]
MTFEASEIEAVPCHVCGANDPADRPQATAQLVLPEPLRIVRCRRCGFMYVSPRLTRAAYARHSLTESYYQSYQRGIRPRLGPGTGARAQVERMQGRHPRPGRVLEIGCATGAFLLEARQAGWQVAGVEPSSYMAAAAREQGLDVAADFVPERYGPDAFDVVHMNHVLEHVPDPAATLRGVCQVLAPDGLLIVEVPYEFGGWFFTLYPILKPGSRRPNIHHLSFFSPRTLARCLAGAGFAAEVRTRSPKVRTSGSRWSRWGWTALAFAADPLNRGENIEAFARRRASGPVANQIERAVAEHV